MFGKDLWPLTLTLPSPRQSRSNFYQVALGLMQASFEYFQGWIFHNLSGQLVVIFNHPQYWKSFSFHLIVISNTTAPACCFFLCHWCLPIHFETIQWNMLNSLQVSQILTSQEFVQNNGFLNPMVFLRRAGEMWVRASCSLPPVCSINTCRWFRCAEKGKRGRSNWTKRSSKTKRENYPSWCANWRK